MPWPCWSGRGRCRAGGVSPIRVRRSSRSGRYAHAAALRPEVVADTNFDRGRTPGRSPRRQTPRHDDQNCGTCPSWRGRVTAAIALRSGLVKAAVTASASDANFFPPHAAYRESCSNGVGILADQKTFRQCRAAAGTSSRKSCPLPSPQPDQPGRRSQTIQRGDRRHDGRCLESSMAAHHRRPPPPDTDAAYRGTHAARAGSAVAPPAMSQQQPSLPMRFARCVHRSRPALRLASRFRRHASGCHERRWPRHHSRCRRRVAPVPNVVVPTPVRCIAADHTSSRLSTLTQRAIKDVLLGWLRGQTSSGNGRDDSASRSIRRPPLS